VYTASGLDGHEVRELRDSLGCSTGMPCVGCSVQLKYHDDDCFYYHSWRNNVVIAFGTLSSFLT